MAVTSAGLLVHRPTPTGRQVLLVHPGGPFWARRDLGAWSIPKGEFTDGVDDPLREAEREFAEELGVDPPAAARVPLGTVRQKAGKVVHAWAVEGDVEPRVERCNTFEIEWPRGSGRRLTIPEVDRAEFFDLTEARRRILAAQVPFLDRLEELAAPSHDDPSHDDP